MGLIFGLIKRLVLFCVYLILFIAAVVLIPNLPPYTKFTSIELDPTQPRVGPLKPNGALNNAQRLYSGKLIGPEAFALYNGEVYTTLASGEVVKLSPGGHVTFVTKLGQPCEGLHQEEKCGRPLGLATDDKGQLYVADAYHGIWRVDARSDRRQLLVSPRAEIEGRKPMMFNALAVANNGDLYWTDSSSDFHLNKGVKATLADPTGRLLHYSAATNKSRVLLDGLWFANGVALSPDQSFVVVAETSRYQLLKYHLSGPNRGKSEAFLTGLPGAPDNLQALPDGSGLTVGLYLAFEEDAPFLGRSLARAPALRKFAARALELAEMPLRFLHTQFPNAALESIVNSIGSFKSVSGLMPSSSGLLAVDWSGRVVEAYFNTDGSLSRVSDAVVHQGRLLTGSPHQDFVGSLPAPPLLQKAYAAAKAPPPKAETVTKQPPKPTQAPKVKVEKKEAPKVEATQAPPKPTQAPPKPTQAPPKPTQAPPKPTQAPPKPTQAPPKPTQAPPKPTQAPPKPTEPPRTTPPPTEKVPTTAKPPATKPLPKQTESTTAKPAQKPATPPKQPEKVEKPAKSEKKASGDATQNAKTEKPAPEPTPITEEIPSDTKKPIKEKLKVIKKGVPTEIPNPVL